MLALIFVMFNVFSSGMTIFITVCFWYTVFHANETIFHAVFLRSSQSILSLTLKLLISKDSFLYLNNFLFIFYLVFVSSGLILSSISLWWISFCCCCCCSHAYHLC